MKHKKTIQLIVGAVAVLAVGFFAGSQYSKSSNTGFPSDMMMGGRGAGQFINTNGGARRGLTGGGLVAGEVMSKDAATITVKLTDGGSKIVVYSGSTVVSKQAQGSISDVAVGTHVTVVGAANADGSVTAQSIQLRPATSTVAR